MTYRRGSYVIGIGPLPGLKKPCLYIESGCRIRKVASFNSQEEADTFAEWFEYFINLRGEPREER